MKLRLLGSKLRLRVTRGEVEALAAGAPVVEVVPFAEGCELRYRLRPDDAVAVPTAAFTGGTIEVRLPVAAVARWVGSDEVGMQAEQSAGAGATLTILVEKDFACLQPREEEDESDMYDHPDAGTRETC